MEPLVVRRLQLATNEHSTLDDDNDSDGPAPPPRRKLALSEPRPQEVEENQEEPSVAPARRARRRPRAEHVSTPPMAAEDASERASKKIPRAKKAKGSEAAASARLHSLPFEITGVVLFALDVLLAFSLLSYSSRDGQAGHAVDNWIGPGGAFVADLLTLGFGLLAFATPLALLAIVVACFRPIERPRLVATRTAAALLSALSAMTLLHLITRSTDVVPFPAGGLLGAVVAQTVSRALAPLGTGVVATALFVIGAIIAADRRVGGVARALIAHVVAGWHNASENLAVWREERRLLAEESVRHADTGPPVVLDDHSERSRQRAEHAATRQTRVNDKAQARVQQKLQQRPRLALQFTEPVTDGPTDSKVNLDIPVVTVAVAPATLGLAAALPAPPTTVEEVSPHTLQSDPPWTKNLDDGVVISLAEAMEKARQKRKATAGPAADIVIDDEELVIVERNIKDPANLVAQAEQAELADEDDAPTREYQLPPLNLLDYDAPVIEPIDQVKLRTQADKLIAKFLDFGIEGRVREIRPGPVVTTYEFVPAPGIKVSKIAALSDDIAMAMEAIHVRIVAPIPGKGAIGIEIPNEKRETVYMKEIIADPAFKKRDEKLLMALGKDIEGKSYYANLADMPHVLIAGTTGSGKSVSVNAMICSILYRATPEDVRFMMIDPKMLELSLYDGIPHLLLPPIIDSKKAAVALKWCVAEMERRYQLLSDVGVRDLKGFNDRVLAGTLSQNGAVTTKLRDKDGRELTKLPFIVVIIDEYADLLAVAGKDVEAYVMRIAQKARAAGIHVMLATQRPSVDVITGVIKANFPVRMGFRLASNHDSKTIINQVGAEKLLGRGDMLFMPPGTSNVMRVHGAFISEKELHRVVDFLKAQGKPRYDMDILKYQDEGNADGEGSDEDAVNEPKDARYDEAVALVARSKKCSTSYVQRMLNIGYQRSARIVDRMERDGLVGAAINTKGDREIHVRPDDPRAGGNAGGMNSAFKDER